MNRYFYKIITQMTNNHIKKKMCDIIQHQNTKKNHNEITLYHHQPTAPH